jgi:hypothetical protein
MRKNRPPPTCTGPISKELVTRGFYSARGLGKRIEDREKRAENGQVDDYTAKGPGEIRTL